MIRARFEKISQIFPGCPETVILPLAELAAETAQGTQGTQKDRPCVFSLIIAEIPSIIWPDHMETVRKQLKAVKEAGITDVMAENLGAIALAKEFGMRAHGGMFLNVLNTEALDQYRAMGMEDVTLSFELAFAESRGLAAPDTGFVTYGCLPLMKFRNCPSQGKNGCGSCSGRNELIDRKGEHFPILCRERQYSELLNCVPLYVGDRRRPQTGFETLYFTVETRAQCREIYETYRMGAPAAFRRTAGLYFREVQ